MRHHPVRVFKDAETHDRSESLAWKLAEVECDDAPIDHDVEGLTPGSFD